jgi:hypothetical protein
MGELTFGKPLGLLQAGDRDAWLENVISAMKLTVWFGLLRYFPTMRLIWRALMPAVVVRARLETFAYTSDKVKARLDEGSGVIYERPDIWKYVIDAGEQESISAMEMFSNAEVREYP